MKYFVLEKFKYMRGYEHNMPQNEMCKNGFTDLKKAEACIVALKFLNHRPDMVSFIIVQENEQSWPTGLGKEENAK